MKRHSAMNHRCFSMNKYVMCLKIHELAMMVNLGSLTNNTTQYSHANLSGNIRVGTNQSGEKARRERLNT